MIRPPLSVVRPAASPRNLSAQVWLSDWGSLYAPDMPKDYGERIAQLQKEADAIVGGRLEACSADYGVGKPFKEFTVKKEKKPDLI